ncbi:hypothetical protein SGO26_30515 (plasmid) [Cupriavidus metallidurans]|jgi:hypothetical protein|uniref:Uncharacterized protein n=2 Tax=Cupriavidus TaxID=106589 RepID=A0A3G8GVL5_9BURK|nr:MULTISPECIES: hypothetical protein [Cupriavidus]AVA38060.1 hypothetical protein C3Z06_31110 [Cupriavidus metallidurans]AZG12030.1 hypothetical protein EHF44_00665 [Cupriavidus pauculus]MCA3187618.1 hypothetical protein [Cupriavidus sp.]MCA3188601.1 hypothetical protein [Cupriavidus sp.]MCA3231978.1 hypothetical protein [Cupriavidus sp.]
MPKREIDIQDVLREQFESGEAVLVLQAEMPDAALLLAIRTALSYGAAFKVVPGQQLRQLN